MTAQLRTQWVLLLRFSVASLGKAALSIVVILLLKEFLSGVLGQGTGFAAIVAARVGQANALWAFVVLLLGTFLLSAALSYDSQVVAQRLARRFELGLMVELIEQLLRLPVSYTERQRHGDILEAVRQDVSRVRTSIMSYIDITVQGAQAVSYIAAAFIVSPRLAVTALPVLLIAGLPVHMFAKDLAGRSQVVRRSGFRTSDLILQLIRGARVIKIYAGERAEARNTIARAQSYFDELVASVRTRALGTVAVEAVAGLSITVVTVIGGFDVLAGRLTVPSLIAFLLATRSMHGPLNNAVTQLLEVRRNRASVERVREILSEVPEIADQPNAMPIDAPIQSITFDHVSFAYDGERDALHDISFSVTAGQTIGIAGPSGSGKTTLINLLARFYDPNSGRVLLNGRDVREYRVADFYQRIALVTQEPFIFETTVRENIRYGDPTSDDTRVENAAKDAELHQEILALPDGYATMLGVGARALSGGQMQRLNIARAMCKNAPLLILDEATSNIDSIAEARVQSALTRLVAGRTTFLIAHRLSTLRQADRILVLEGGRLVGDGPHESLLVDCPLYRDLCQTQRSTADIIEDDDAMITVGVS